MQKHTKQMTVKATALKNVDTLIKTVFQWQNESQCDATAIQIVENILALLPKHFLVDEIDGTGILLDNRPSKKRGTPVPTIVAHLDQVHRYVRGYQLAMLGDKMVAYDIDGRRVGTGGDDKCGIYVALKMLLSDIPCRAILVHDEEVGCCGSHDAPDWWGDESSVLLQADRRGNNDLIPETNGRLIAPQELIEATLALPECKDMTIAVGSITDVGELCPKFNVAGFNISSGYYEAHSSREYVNLSELEVTLSRVMAIARMVGDTVYECPEQPVYSRGWSSSHDFYYDPRLDKPLGGIKAGQSYMSLCGLMVGPMKAHPNHRGVFFCDDKDIVASINAYLKEDQTVYSWEDTGHSYFDASLDLEIKNLYPTK